MTSDVILSRCCMVGPGGYFHPGVGPAEVDGAVTVRIDFCRPEADPDPAQSEFPTYWCAFSIVYGEVVIYSTGDLNRACGIDATNALLSAMRSAVSRMEIRAFDALDGSGRFGDVIPYLDAIPPEWWHDMRYAGSDPDWIAEQKVVFQRADGERIDGVIGIGCPSSGAPPDYPPSCDTSLYGLEEKRRIQITSDSAFHALQLAMASMATRLRAFPDAGGRVLTPSGDADVDLAAMFGPLVEVAP
jgi:hypothetical protein